MPFKICSRCEKQVRLVDAKCWNCKSTEFRGVLSDGTKASWTGDRSLHASSRLGSYEREAWQLLQRNRLETLERLQEHEPEKPQFLATKSETRIEQKKVEEAQLSSPQRAVVTTPWRAPKWYQREWSYLRRQARYAALALTLTSILLLKAAALLFWLADPDQQPTNTIYGTSPAHTILAFVFVGLNLGLATAVKDALKEVNWNWDVHPLFELTVIFAALWVSGREARTVCVLLGWKHTGWVVF